MIKNLLKLADGLDKVGSYREANNVSELIRKYSQIGADPVTTARLILERIAAGSRVSPGMISVLKTLLKTNPTAVMTAIRGVSNLSGLMARSAIIPELASLLPSGSAAGVSGAAAGASGAGSAAGVASAGAGIGVAAATGALIAAGLAGLAVGTVINKGLEKAGVNASVINWLLQPSLKDGIKYKVYIDTRSIDPSLLKGAVAFVPYGVSGVLMNGSQIVNKNSNAKFPDAKHVRLGQAAQVTLPRNENGILIPTSASAIIIYSDGSKKNAISTSEGINFMPGNFVSAGINKLAKTAK